MAALSRFAPAPCRHRERFARRSFELVIDAVLISPDDVFARGVGGRNDEVATQLVGATRVKSVRAARGRAMPVHQTNAVAFAVIENGASDVGWERARGHELLEAGDAFHDGAPNGRSEGVDSLAHVEPLCLRELRNVGEAATAPTAPTTTRPPRMRGGRRLGSTLDVFIDGEEATMHDSGAGGARFPSLPLRATPGLTTLAIRPIVTP